MYNFRAHFANRKNNIAKATETAQEGLKQAKPIQIPINDNIVDIWEYTEPTTANKDDAILDKKEFVIDLDDTIDKIIDDSEE